MPLLRLLKAHPGLTAKQAAEQLGLSQRAVEKHRIGPNKGGHWQVVG